MVSRMVHSNALVALSLICVTSVFLVARVLADGGVGTREQELMKRRFPSTVRHEHVAAAAADLRLEGGSATEINAEVMIVFLTVVLAISVGQCACRVSRHVKQVDKIDFGAERHKKTSKKTQAAVVKRGVVRTLRTVDLDESQTKVAELMAHQMKASAALVDQGLTKVVGAVCLLFNMVAHTKGTNESADAGDVAACRFLQKKGRLSSNAKDAIKKGAKKSEQGLMRDIQESMCEKEVHVEKVEALVEAEFMPPNMFASRCAKARKRKRTGLVDALGLEFSPIAYNRAIVARGHARDDPVWMRKLALEAKNGAPEVQSEEDMSADEADATEALRILEEQWMAEHQRKLFEARMAMWLR